MQIINNDERPVLSILLAYSTTEKVEKQKKSMTPISLALESQNNCGHTRPRPAIHVFVVCARFGENHVGEKQCDRCKEVMTRHSNSVKNFLKDLIVANGYEGVPMSLNQVQNIYLLISDKAKQLYRDSQRNWRGESSASSTSVAGRYRPIAEGSQFGRGLEESENRRERG